jgi:hypothetical protein
LKRSKTKLAKCPSCLTDKHRTEIQACISILEKIERQEFKHYRELKLDQYTYGSFIDSNFEWACDQCLETKKAILASPGLQETARTPHLAYSDTKLNCSSCSKEFLFKKEEKKVWYETYKLPINAEPNNCLDCRREIRKQNLANKTISEILKKTEAEITDKELETAVEIYTSWDKMDKAKYYQSKLNKRNKNDSRRA